MVTLIYHKVLDDSWIAAARALRSILGSVPSCTQVEPAIVGRSRKQKIALDHDFVLERFQIGGREYHYKQVEGAFSQVCTLHAHEDIWPPLHHQIV